MTKKSFTALVFALFSFCNSASAMPALGDYNADGRSDFAVAQVNRSGSNRGTAWLARLSESAAAYWTFTTPGDALVTGKWYGDGKVYPGLVYVRDASLPLEWHLKNPDGGEVTFNYGIPGDTIPNQGDLDCDGVTDLVVVRNGTSGHFPGLKVWYAALSGHGGQIVEDAFGFSTDRVATADLDGDGCQELIALRDGFYWFGKKLLDTSFSQVQWGLPGDYPLLPQDLDGDGLADYAVARATGSGQVVYLKRSNGGFDVLPAGFDTSVPMLGKFYGLISVGWFQRNTGGAAYLNFDRTATVFNFGISSNAIIRPDGTVVQPTETGRFGESGGGSGGGGGSGDSSTLVCDREIDRNDGSGGYKSNANNSRHTLKEIFPTRLNGNIDSVVAFSNGQVFDRLHFMGFEYGPREWWNGSKNISAYPDNLIVAVNRKDGIQECVTLPDPQTTYD